MRTLIAALAVLLLTCAPISAQTGVPSTPAPTPLPELPNDTVNRVVDTAVRGAESIGATAFVAVIVSMISLLVVLLAGYLVVRVGVMPLLNLIRDERMARREERDERLAKERELAEYRERQYAAQEMMIKLQTQQAQQFETTVTKVIAMETKQEASDGRNELGTRINDHTDEGFRIQLEDIRQIIHEALKALNLVQSRNEQRASEQHETQDMTLAKSASLMIEAEKKVRKLGDTGPLGQPREPTNDKHKPEGE